MKITKNYKKRYYTIWLNCSKYRTIKMTKDEFLECLFNTQTDWKNYLRTNDVLILK